MNWLFLVHLKPSRIVPLLLGGLWGLGVLPQPVRGQVAATDAGGLNTAVNGVVGGSCSSGLCQVTGGTAAGSNLFHRFSSFDTRGAISGVQILNGAFANVVVGVTAPLGSFIDKPVSLSTPGSLVWLSPGGLAVSGAGGFVNTTQLTLSTATNQLVGAGRFDVFGTTPQQAALLTAMPRTGAADLVLDPALRAMAGMAPDPEIVLQGIHLTVDRSLLVDNPGGLVSVAGSTLSASSTSGTGGSITLTGRDVWIDGLSSLLATGPAGGGLIQVGGSWQNSDGSVRQAVNTWVGAGALLDASATAHGNGGTVVVWSDITNPLGSTVVSGTLQAKGGPQGGDGGLIETSGAWLNVDGISVSARAFRGNPGTWLLDPNDLTISTSGNQNLVQPTYTANPALATSNLNVTTLGNELRYFNVSVIADGNITVQNPIEYGVGGGGVGSLTLQAGGGIVLNSSINLSTTAQSQVSVTLVSGTGGLSGSVGTGISVQSGLVTGSSINVNQGGTSTYGGVIAGTGVVLNKLGVGSLTLTGANTHTGGTSVQAGILNIQNGSALGTGAVNVSAGASLGLSGGITVANAIGISGAGPGLIGSLRNLSGDNTITGQVSLQFSDNTIAADGGSLTFDRPGTTASAIVVNTAYQKLDLVLGGAGNLVFNDSVNLSYSLQGGTAYGDLIKKGAGTVFLNAPNQLGATLGINGGALAYSNVDFFGGAVQAARAVIVDGGVLRSQVSDTINASGNSTFLLGANGGGWQVDPGLTVTFTGAMSGAGSFTKSGAGELILSGAHGFQGALNVVGGLLLVSGSLPDTTAMTVSAGAIYQLGASDTIGSIAGSGSINLGSFTLTAGSNGASTTFGGTLLGAGNLIKSGAGTLTLTGANSYTGTTTVTGGTLTVNQMPPSTATCSGGSSNICPTATITAAAIQSLLTPSISVTPGFSVSSTTTMESSTTATSISSTSSISSISSTSSSDSTSSTSTASTSLSSSETSDSGALTASGSSPAESADSQPVAMVPADGSTLISYANVDVVSSLESSFSTSEIGATTSGTSSDSGTTNGSTTNGSTMNGSTTNGSTSDSSKTEPAQSEAARSDSGKADSGQSDSGKPEAAVTGASASGTSAGSGPPPTVIVSAQQAAASSQQSDLKSGQQALSNLAPERANSALVAPSVPQMQQSLSNATNQVRNGGLGPQSRLPRPGTGADSWLLATAEPLPGSSDAGRAALLPLVFNRAAYTPAVLHVRFSEARGGTVRSDTDAFLDLTLVPMQGEVEGRRVEVSKQDFAALLKQLYTQLSRQESLNNSNPSAPARRLYELLIGPIAPVLAKRGITTLLISADRGLQAVPFAALHDGQRYFGDTYAFSLTPSLALTSMALPQAGQGRLLAAGAAVFDGLAPLPLVPSELDQVGRIEAKDVALNRSFTPSTLLEQAADPRYSRVHVATHAEFLPGGPAASRLYSGTVPIPLSDFVKLRRARQGPPLDLISFSACRTALGDADSELGFAGLALQVGALSAVGTLWYVDDVATSAYFVQMYRYLEAGIPKAEALQLTRQAFSRGLVRLDGDQLLGPEGRALLSGLTSGQQRRVAGGLQNPYFWAGVELLGAAW